MRLLISVWLVLCCTGNIYAQRSRSISLYGSVLDSLNYHPLPRATVLLIPETDTAKTKFQVTNEQGAFAFTEVVSGTYRLQISYVGYQSWVKTIHVSNKTTKIQLHSIGLLPQIQHLSEVSVYKRVPIRQLKDTLEYNAELFTSNPNTLLEDLLKDLPGIEFEIEGAVRAQGEMVQQILVDGKPFFGHDLKMATQNLPASIIKAVQVFDKRSDQTSFSGVDDGQRTRVINILTKPEGQHGLFGQQVAGLGSAERYLAGIGLHTFRKGQQLSLLGQANNINQQGYSLPNVSSRSLNSSPNPSPSTGTIRSLGTGLNLSKSWGNRTELAANYLFADATTQLDQTKQRQTLSLTAGFPVDTATRQSTLLSRSQLTTATNTTSHSLNFQVKYQLNSKNVIQLLPSLSLNLLSNATLQSTQTQIGQQLLNQTLAHNFSSGIGFGATSTLLWVHRFSRAGRTFSLQMKTESNQIHNHGSNDSKNNFLNSYRNLDSLAVTTINQHSMQTTKSMTNDWNLIYTEPISPQHTLLFSYRFTRKSSSSDRFVTTANTGTGIANLPDSLLSNQYKNIVTTNRLGSSWLITQPTYNFIVGADVQRITLCSDNKTVGDPVNREIVNVLPSLMFQPKLTQHHTAQIQYQTQALAPTVFQLQPVANTTDPLNIQLGNSALRPEYSHLITLNYRTFQPETYHNFYALVNLKISQHHIIDAVRIDSMGIQTNQPINANGYSMGNITVAFSRPVKVARLKSTLNLTTNGTLMNSSSLINEQMNRSRSLLLSQSIKVTASLANSVEIGLSASIHYQTASYSLQPLLTNHSLNTLLYSQLYCPLPWGFKLSTDLTCAITAGRSTGYNQQFTLWNGYLSRTFLKTQQAELRLQGFDLLNQNRSLSRVVTNSFIEDGQNNTLKRYWLVTFVYNLRQFGQGH